MSEESEQKVPEGVKVGPIAAELRKIRRAMDLTQAEFGPLLGISAKSYPSYENGHRNPDEGMLKAARSAYEERFGVVWNLYGVAPESNRAANYPENLPPPLRQYVEATDPRVLPKDLAMADQWVEELVLQGREHFQLRDRWEWIHMVAAEIAAARVRGRIQDAREKVETFVRLAKGLGGGESKQ